MKRARKSKSYKLASVSEHGRGENVTFIHINSFNNEIFCREFFFLMM